MKNFARILAYSLPFLYFLLLFFFYGYGEISLVMTNKIFGLLALSLMGTSLIIGPLSFFVPKVFDQFKVYRKYLGVNGFFVAILHALLSYISYFKKDLNFMFFSSNNPHLLGVYAGLIALVIFGILAITSVDKIMSHLDGKVWKAIQATGYLGLLFVMIHFILIESNKGIFIIRRPLGQYIFAFGILVLGLRLIVLVVKKFRK